MNRLMVRWLLVICVCLYQVNATAQDASIPTTETDRATVDRAATERESETVVRQILPDVMVVNPEGHIIAMPGWSHNLLTELYRLFRQDPQHQESLFSIRNVSATGKVIGNFVEVEAQIELVTSGHQPVRIPLGFKEGILPSEDLTDKPPFRYTGPGSAELTVDPQ